MNDTADWGLWLDLIEAHPGEEAAVTAQLAVHLELDPRPVAEVCAAWLRPDLELGAAEAPPAETPSLTLLPSPTTPQAPRAAPAIPRAVDRSVIRPWLIAATSAAAAAGLVVLLDARAPETEGGADQPRQRGAADMPLDLGVVRIEADGAAAGRAVVGAGLRPGVAATRELLLRWSPPPGVQGGVYLIRDGAPGPLTALPADGLLLQAPLPEAVVIVAAPAGATALAGVPERVGDGRGATSALGSVQLLVIDVLIVNDTGLGAEGE